MSSSLVNEFRFGEGAAAAPNSRPDVPSASSPVAQPADPCAGAADHWRSAEAKDHLARFPDCASAGLARARIEELKSKDVAAIVPPVQPAAPPAPAQISANAGTFDSPGSQIREVRVATISMGIE